jgi:hypothetical protein
MVWNVDKIPHIDSTCIQGAEKKDFIHPQRKMTIFTLRMAGE